MDFWSIITCADRALILAKMFVQQECGLYLLTHNTEVSIAEAISLVEADIKVRQNLLGSDCIAEIKRILNEICDNSIYKDLEERRKLLHKTFRYRRNDLHKLLEQLNDDIVYKRIANCSSVRQVVLDPDSLKYLNPFHVLIRDVQEGLKTLLQDCLTYSFYNSITITCRHGQEFTEVIVQCNPSKERMPFEQLGSGGSWTTIKTKLLPWCRHFIIRSVYQDSPGIIMEDEYDLKNLTLLKSRQVDSNRQLQNEFLIGFSLPQRKS